MRVAPPLLFGFAALIWMAGASLRAAEPAPIAAPVALSPFVATYQAYNAGRAVGSATMQLIRSPPSNWRIDLQIRGDRGFAGIVGLNVEQSTHFDESGGNYRPLGQSSVRKAIFMGRKTVGSYDWKARVARWDGALKAERKRPVPLREGDMSGLLINLAIIRDAQPGRRLQYRFVEAGRVRDHVYQVATEAESIEVGELTYQALRVSRINGGNDETIVWVASGVPTPIRILQRTDGSDAIDLRLIEYHGVS